LQAHLPGFGSTGIIFYTGDIQWQQREIFSSILLEHHGIFASRGQALKMHLLEDEAMKEALERQASSMPENQRGCVGHDIAVTPAEVRLAGRSDGDCRRLNQTRAARFRASFDKPIVPFLLAFQRPLLWR